MGFFKAKTCIIVGGCLGFVIIISIILGFFIFVGLFTIQKSPGSETEMGVTIPSSDSTKETEPNIRCSIDYDTNSDNWVEERTEGEMNVSIRIPKSFTGKANNEENFEIRGSSKKGCEHYLIINYMDYPYPAVDCKTNFESAQSVNIEGSVVTDYKSENIAGIDACIFNTTVTEATGNFYRRSYMFYFKNKYYFVGSSAYDKDTIEFYDSIVKTIKFN